MCQYPWIYEIRILIFWLLQISKKNSSELTIWAVQMSMNVVSVYLIIDRKYFYIFIKASGMNQKW